MSGAQRTQESSQASSPPEGVTLLVEGPADVQMLQWLFEAAEYPTTRIQITPTYGKMNAARVARQIKETSSSPVAILIDLDEQHVADARARAYEQLGHPEAEVFCAVPCLEAWLFADDEAVRAHASPDEEVLSIVRRLPFPEEIPEPKTLAHYVFGPPSRWAFMRQIDVGRASARSPSLRSFLEGMEALLGLPPKYGVDALSRNMNRDVFATLVGELPSNTVVWRTSEGTYTAEELRRHIESGTEIGRQYASDLLRVARDLLMRTVHRSTSR